ncbi:polyketide synthase [Acanthopleuribacter pedis]|uniref:Amino acid adenylation domain-containing protein n=1 Tax=Acanthopleuribacter pedis TaxID=442870 RepID=A0A8J7QCH6_9BACT|nr:polyketide synthase [Acanthopleuribacter pedis]MBO1318461.1 amino acid adenylation domain-containing protein [Acanthopleuribacter pedis]
MLENQPIHIRPFRCRLIGQGNMLIRCGEMLREQGHRILGVVTEDPTAVAWCAEAGIPQHRYEDRDQIGNEPFEYLFSIVNFHILEDDLISLPTQGCINFHDGPLPDYAGRNTPAWALINGASSYGITWHELVPAVDAGRILVKRDWPIGAHDTAAGLNTKCFFAGLEAFAELIQGLASDTLKGGAQPERKRRFYNSTRKPKGNAVLDFRQPAVKLANLHRGLNFGTYANPLALPKAMIASASGARFLIPRRLERLNDHNDAAPGTVVAVDNAGVTVATGDGELHLSRFIDGDGRAVDIEETGLQIGSRFRYPEAATLKKINTLQKELARHEAFWRNRLATTQPLRARETPARTHAYGSGTLNALHSHRVSLADLCLALKRVLQREYGFSGDTFALQSELEPLDDCPIHHHWLPFPVADETSTIAQEIKTTRRALGFTADLPARLAKNEADPDWTPQVGITFDGACDTATPPIHIHYGSRTIQMNVDTAFDFDAITLASQVEAELIVLRQTPLGNRLNESSKLPHGRVASTEYPRAATIHALFEAQVAKTPHAVAAEFGAVQLSYAELNEATNRLAHALIAKGTQRGDLVGICMERSEQMLIALLATLKAGAAYLPLDPAYPADRLAMICEDGDVALILTNGEQPDWLNAQQDRLDLEASAAWISEQPNDNLAIGTSGDLAYAIYTSGSTGRPKGVLIGHQSVVNFLYTMQRQPGINPADRLLAVTSISFDISVLELFLPILFGATVIIADRATAADGRALADLIQSSTATMMQATPATWEMLFRAGRPPQAGFKVLSGGEAISRDLASRLLDHVGPFFNLYGPTETTIWSTCCHVTSAENAIPIGKPIANTQIYILDDQFQAVPAGTQGNLYIGGEGLSLGYRNRPDLTAERFLSDPFSDQPGARMYWTGDLASFTEDGVIEFHGRADFQVKIRGFRIELEEIEAILDTHPAIEKAIVTARRGEDGGEAHLVGYLIAERDQISLNAARTHLENNLPRYMHPEQFVLVTAMPLTPNGKVDRKSLPAPTRENLLLDGSFKAASSAVEQQLAKIWGTVLKTDSVGVDDNFFELGGTSLLVGLLNEKLAELTGDKVDTTLIFAYPTVRTMAQWLNQNYGTRLQQTAVTKPKAAKTQPAQPRPKAVSKPKPVAVVKTTPAPAPNKAVAKPITIRATAPATNSERITKSEGFAVVGMACRFPGANDIEQFWQNLRVGIDSVTEVPSQRWDWRRFYDPNGRRKAGTVSKWQGLVNGVDHFDYKFFGISAVEARRMDPMQRLILEVAWHAVEHAGYRPSDFTNSSTGVYMGLIANEYPNYLRGTDAFWDAHTGTGNALSLVANRISYLFNWQGPSMVVDTACSSSLVAVDLACNALREGLISTALVGGVNLILEPDNTIRFSQGGMLSPQGRCQTFDDEADGYVRGEGAGALVIKPLERAIEDGDTIWCVIKGTAVNHDGHQKVGLTAPSPLAQQNVIRKAYNRAGVTPDTIDYIEAHGTGTSLGDPIEIRALAEVFRRESSWGSTAIGSVKSNIGHLEPAAGVAGIIKVALALTNGEIPPTLHVRNPNRHISFEETPFYINDRARMWRKKAHPRRAGVSSFGFGGTNAHLIIEEAPDALPPEKTASEYHVLTLSAKEVEPLRDMLRAWNHALDQNNLCHLADLCYTANIGRELFEHRVALVVNSIDQLSDKLHLAELVSCDQKLRRLGIFRSTEILEEEKESRVTRICAELARADWEKLVRWCPAVAEYPCGDANPPKQRLLFTALAELFALGFAVDWQAVDGRRRPRRLPLPTYPFVARTCRVPRPAMRRNAGSPHPLIFREQASLGQALFEPFLQRDGNWVLDQHIVNDKAVLPGAAMLDLACFALNRIQKPMHLTDISFMAPIFEREKQDGGVMLNLQPGSGEQLAININESAGATRFFSAMSGAGDLQVDAVPAKPHRAMAHEIDIDELYSQFEHAGLMYGPLYRCLRSVQVYDNLVFGEVALEESVQIDDHLLHPALLDAAFQCALAPLATRAQALYLPFLVEELQLHQALPRRFKVIAELTTTEPGSPLLRGNLTFLGENDQLLAHFRDMSWKRVSQENRAVLARRIWRPATLSEQPLPQGHWLIFGDDNAVIDSLRAGLEQRGSMVTQIVRGDHFQILAPDRVAVNPEKGEDYVSLRHLADRMSPRTVGLLHCWSLTNAGDNDAALVNGVHALSHLARAWHNAKTPEGEEDLILRVITCGATAASSQFAPANAALTGLTQVIRREFPRLNCGTVDLGRFPKTINDERMWYILESLVDPNPEILLPEASLKALVPDLDPQWTAVKDAPAIRRGGVYLITGGLGGIGLATALWLAREYNTQLALITRSGRVSDPELLKQIRQTGVALEIIRADVADEEQMERALHQVHLRLGRVHGIFHAAGILRDKLLINSDREDFDAVLRPKVQGTLILDKLTARDKPELMVLFSSVSGLFGNPGQGAYAAANRFMDRFAEQRDAAGNRTISISWGLWREVGMGTDFVETAEARGYCTHTTLEGLSLMKRAMGLSEATLATVPAKTFFNEDRPAQAAKPATPKATAAPKPRIALTPAPAAQSTPQSQPAATAAASAAAVNTEDLHEAALELVVTKLADTLECAADEVQHDIPFLEMGLDSMLSINLVKDLEDHTAKKLPRTLFFDYANVEQLAEALVNRYQFQAPGGEAQATQAAAAPQPVAKPAAQPTPQPTPRLAVKPVQPAPSQATVAAPKPASAKPAAVKAVKATAVADTHPAEAPNPAPIAVIGMAGRMPGAANLDELWDVLKNGRDVVGEVPEDRWDIKRFFDEDPETTGTTYSRWGGFLEKLYDFDPLFFRISPMEAEWIDPQQRILMETAWETIEDAGYAGGHLRGSKTGVFVGASYTHYRDQKVGDVMPTFAGLGNLNAILTNRLSYFLDLRGPCMTVDTLCSSSLVAVNLAVESLRRGESEYALAGGVHADLSPRYYQMACRLRAFSPTGRCRTFDKGADGFVPGEGVGLILLKRLDKALADGDHIHGVIRGTAVNHGGQSSGLTVPSRNAQAELVRTALNDAGLKANDLSYIEAHGTGTSLGDPIEVGALSQVFEDDTDQTGFCGIGSLKTNIGHLEPAAGIAGLLKVLLCLREKQIPASLHVKEENPEIDFANSPFYVNTKLKNWQPVQGVRRAGVSSFGMGGVNGHVILEEAPAVAEPNEPSGRSEHVLTLSARGRGALEAMISRFAHLKGAARDASVGDLCYSANTGRTHFNHRLAVVGSNTEEILEKLARLEPQGKPRRLPAGVIFGKGSRAPKTAMLFTGQGSQYPNMGRDLYETQPVFRATLDDCADVLKDILPIPLLDLLYDPQHSEDIHNTVYAQPALFAVEYAAACMWLDWGVKPSAVLGHSVGEYVAACVAGVFGMEEGLRLVAERGRLMGAEPLGVGTMAAILAPRDQVQPLLDTYPQLAVAAENGPANTVISGERQQLEALLGELKGEIQVMRLRVSHAFHSPMLDPILDNFEALAAKTTYRKPRIPLISNLTGKAKTAVPDAAYWRDHLRGTVAFASGIETLHQMGITHFLEVGPHPTLSSLGRHIRNMESAMWIPTMERGRDNGPVVMRALSKLYTAGTPIDWEAFNRDSNHRRVPLPTYAFERRTYRAPDPKPTHQNPVVQADKANAHPLHPLIDRRVVIQLGGSDS